MAATRATIDALLKELYEGDVNNQINEEVVTSKRIEKTANGVVDSVGGKHVVFPVRNKRNSGISYRPESTALGAPGKQGYARAIEILKYGYGRFQITGPAMEMAETNQQSFMDSLDGEMEGLKQDIAKDVNRITYGHKDSATFETGIVTKIVSYADPVLTVDNPWAVQLGMIVDVVDSAGTVGLTGQEVIDIDEATGEVTLSVGGAGPAADEYLVRSGNWGEEPYGLAALVGNTGTLHQIDSDAAGNGYWQSQLDSTTTTLTEQAMINMCDNVRRKGGGRATAVFCSLGVRRAYYNIMLSDRRYVDPKSFPGGLVGLSFNHGKEIPVVEDVDCPDKHMYFLDEREIKIFRNKDWYFDDKDGAILKWRQDYDDWQGLMKCYWQMATHKRSAHGVMNNITEPVA